jgi:hypothetical protein
MRKGERRGKGKEKGEREWTRGNVKGEGDYQIV